MRQPLLWTKGVIPMETTEVNEWGSIHISQRVIASIAALTAAKAAYVADLGMNIAEAAAEKLGRTAGARRRCHHRGPAHRADGPPGHPLWLPYSRRSLEVQKSVKDAVEKATACTVTAVHIIVQQLVFEEDRHDG